MRSRFWAGLAGGLIPCWLMLLTGCCCCAPAEQHVLLPSTCNLLQAMPPDLARELSKQVLPPYLVEPGDVLLVQGTDGLAPEQPVLADGTISLGRYGVVVVANKTLPEIEILIGSAIGNQVKEPGPVGVRLSAGHSKVFYVLGEVKSPGAYPLTGHETVLDGIMAACGLTCRAAKCRIILSRPTSPDRCRIVLPICYDEIVQQGDTTTNFQLMPGDRIFVPTLSLCESCGLFKKEKPCGGHCSGPWPSAAPCEGSPATTCTASRSVHNFGALTVPFQRYFSWGHTEIPATEAGQSTTPVIPAMERPNWTIAPSKPEETSKSPSPGWTLPAEAFKPIAGEKAKPLTFEAPKPAAETLGAQTITMSKPVTMPKLSSVSGDTARPAVAESSPSVSMEATKPASPAPTAAELFRQIIFAGRAAPEALSQEATPVILSEQPRSVAPAVKAVSEVERTTLPEKPKNVEPERISAPKTGDPAHEAALPEAIHELKETKPATKEKSPVSETGKKSKPAEFVGPTLPAANEEAKPAEHAEPGALPPIQGEAKPIESPEDSMAGPALPEAHSLDAFLSLFFGSQMPKEIQPVSQAEPQDESEE